MCDVTNLISLIDQYIAAYPNTNNFGYLNEIATWISMEANKLDFDEFNVGLVVTFENPDVLKI